MHTFGPSAAGRRKLGLHHTKQRGFMKTACALAGIVLLFGYMQERDLADKAQAQAEAAQRKADKAEQALINCLNGGAALIIQDQMQAVWCEKATIEKL